MESAGHHNGTATQDLFPSAHSEWKDHSGVGKEFKPVAARVQFGPATGRKEMPVTATPLSCRSKLRRTVQVFTFLRFTRDEIDHLALNSQPRLQILHVDAMHVA